MSRIDVFSVIFPMCWMSGNSDSLKAVERWPKFLRDPGCPSDPFPGPRHAGQLDLHKHVLYMYMVCGSLLGGGYAPAFPKLPALIKHAVVWLFYSLIMCVAANQSA